MKAETQCVKSNLGLVCITTTDAVRYKTVTRKRLLSFDEPTQKEMLRALYQENIHRINNAIDFCQAHGINLYRLTSGLFPFSDESIGADILDEFADQLAVAGNKAVENNLRIVAFPSISTGAFAYPKHEAAEVASKAIEEFLSANKTIEQVRLVFFSDADALKFVKHQTFGLV